MMDTDALFYACTHFIHADRANAAIHCAPVRFSPLTFRLVALYEALAPAHAEDDDDISDVIAHRDSYPLDHGR
jgi:hypothetical protein